jgi:hypothetical protein
LICKKGQDQLDLQALHRVQSHVVSRRTAALTQINAFYIEQPITVHMVRGFDRQVAGKQICYAVTPLWAFERTNAFD